MTKDSKRSVSQIGIAGEVVENYPTASAAATALNLPKNSDSNIIKACNGVRTSAYGYKWQFSDEQFDTEQNRMNQFYLYTFSELSQELVERIELEVIRLKNNQQDGKFNQQTITRLIPKYEYLPHLLIVNMLNDQGGGMRINRRHFCDDTGDRVHWKNIVNVWLAFGVIREPIQANHEAHKSAFYELTEEFKSKVKTMQIQKTSYHENHSIMIKNLVGYKRFCQREDIAGLSDRKKRILFNKQKKQLKEMDQKQKRKKLKTQKDFIEGAEVIKKYKQAKEEHEEAISTGMTLIPVTTTEAEETAANEFKGLAYELTSVTPDEADPAAIAEGCQVVEEIPAIKTLAEDFLDFMTGLKDVPVASFTEYRNKRMVIHQEQEESLLQKRTKMPIQSERSSTPTGIPMKDEPYSDIRDVFSTKKNVETTIKKGDRKRVITPTLTVEQIAEIEQEAKRCFFNILHDTDDITHSPLTIPVETRERITEIETSHEPPQQPATTIVGLKPVEQQLPEESSAVSERQETVENRFKLSQQQVDQYFNTLLREKPDWCRTKHQVHGRLRSKVWERWISCEDKQLFEKLEELLDRLPNFMEKYEAQPPIIVQYREVA